MSEEVVQKLTPMGYFLAFMFVFATWDLWHALVAVFAGDDPVSLSVVNAILLFISAGGVLSINRKFAEIESFRNVPLIWKYSFAMNLLLSAIAAWELFESLLLFVQISEVLIYSALFCISLIGLYIYRIRCDYDVIENHLMTF